MDMLKDDFGTGVRFVAAVDPRATRFGTVIADHDGNPRDRIR
jgi:hypothetical protein